MDCIFCKIVAGEVPSTKLFEDDVTLAFMDVNPAANGHCLIIPKAHYPTVYDIPADAIGRTAATASKIARAVNEALVPDGINLVQANGPGAAQSVLHFHFHVIPRIGGDRLIMNWDQMEGNPNRIAQVAAQIREKL